MRIDIKGTALTIIFELSYQDYQEVRGISTRSALYDSV